MHRLQYWASLQIVPRQVSQYGFRPLEDWRTNSWPFSRLTSSTLGFSPTDSFGFNFKLRIKPFNHPVLFQLEFQFHQFGHHFFTISFVIFGFLFFVFLRRLVFSFYLIIFRQKFLAKIDGDFQLLFPSKIIASSTFLRY